MQFITFLQEGPPYGNWLSVGSCILPLVSGLSVRDVSSVACVAFELC